jgi:microcystin-dependent protein
MALVLKDRVKETSTTTGTGTFTLAGAAAGYQSFSVIGNGNTTFYCIVDSSAGAWEVGIGTYTSSGTALSRDTILESSNSGSAVSFGSGSKDVFVTYPAEKAVSTDDVTSAVASASPAGNVSFFAMSSAPSGWIKANGAAVSRSTYSALFSAIGTTFGAGDGSTTFNVPDLRGEFARGWDDSRGVDSGRSFGTSQLDQLQQVTGNVNRVWALNTYTADGAFSGTTTTQTGIGAGSNHRTLNLNFNNANSSSARVGTETRARNIALLACIKY